MIAKFTDSEGQHIMEVEKSNDGVSFFIYEFGEQQVGQSIVIPLSEMNNLIKHLHTYTLVQ